jgi:hypothetical protein
MLLVLFYKKNHVLNVYHATQKIKQKTNDVRGVLPKEQSIYKHWSSPFLIKTIIHLFPVPFNQN